ncbi:MULTISPECIES: competence/damage-inducible protein A [Prochlorococcus]|uniref:CinA-like protein n=1 Tax=Prochlorococcus marinus (strain SARG / CCMP1375 / SS120) TaxID=167539 RepID=CINAL_PROMA|nr:MULTISPECIES: competence/damage-inducible protein A [Prochlorococcus]Q7VDS9.1 RecName: Full=CinA-like protein [Prochlorococcus marinus subsp. marinus str. CCMP1375]AAP99335.1 CinA ortholog, predicted molybdopterin binding domain [Prochlorococcus marinus subsp. marinus str. CCMP1375]KGG11394.1 Molybdopterin binding motif [Prochlorococcus marinus str. LG]KGG18650.1 Molybdopterin binding motif [Prochlorococcus marinus str. SS2]KGG22923.1 Molybdopterin binding motif [Prochlorococcus marinus str
MSSYINKNQSVEILCIGSELLLGNILNSNAKWLAEQLAFIGLPHYLQSVVGDNSQRLLRIILEASRRSRVLITTGGLGPTPDDLTIETIASAFNVKLTKNNDILKDIKRKLNSHSHVSENNFKQALLPEGAEIIPNKSGTAPGIIWTPIVDFTIISLPGVPAEMKQMWIETAKPWLNVNFPERKSLTSKTLKFAGISESFLAENIVDLLDNKNPTIAPYASLGEVKLRLTAQAKTTSEAKRLIEPIEVELLKRFGLKCFAKNDETLSEIVIGLLSKRGETISLAESCTGGNLAAAFTGTPGASEVFLGGIVAYNNSIKENVLGVPIELIKKHGAVSQPVAKEMALGILKIFNTDWSIAISGIAGPSGSTLNKPIGRVEIFIAGPNVNESIQENFGSYRAREEIQKLSVVRALDQLRLFLLRRS